MQDTEARIEKFKLRAPQVLSVDHLQKIMDSFPEDRRSEILDSVQHLILHHVITGYDEQNP